MEIITGEMLRAASMRSARAKLSPFILLKGPVRRAVCQGQQPCQSLCDIANIHRVAPMLSFYLHNPHHFQWHLEIWQLLPVFLMVNRGNLVSCLSFYLKDSLRAQQPPSLPSLHSLLSLLKKKETNFQESNPEGIPLFCGSAGSFAEKITNIKSGCLIQCLEPVFKAERMEFERHWRLPSRDDLI